MSRDILTEFAVRLRPTHPNFQRMIDDGKAGAFDLVLTKEVSRFARNTVDGLIVTRELLRAEAGVFFVSELKSLKCNVNRIIGKKG